MTDYIDTENIIEELTVFVRNSDILSTTIRGVTTTNDTGTFAADSSHTISVSNIRNIRSIVVAGTTLTFGTDYTVAYNAANVVITFTSAQTGAYTISYDYGTTDKIYPDYDQDDLTISDFPRISIGILSIDTNAAATGNVNLSTVIFNVTIYEKVKKTLRGYIATLRQKFIDAQDNFYYLVPVKPYRLNPELPSPYEYGKDKIMQQSYDFISDLNLEIN